MQGIVKVVDTKCTDPQMGAFLMDYLDNTLDSDHRNQMQTHMSSCARCMNDFHIHQWFEELFAQMSPEDLQEIQHLLDRYK